jgi:signal transduction histidine kinase
MGLMNHGNVKSTAFGGKRQKKPVSYYLDFLCLLLFLSLPTLLSSQKILINQRELKKEDGLASYLIDDICQDQRGFIWIATNEGVNRFDGYEFKLFNNQTHPLIRSDYTKIFAAPDGNLWLIAYGNQMIDSVAGWSNTQIVILDPLREEAYSFQDMFSQKAPLLEKDIFFISQNSTTKALVLTTTKGEVFSYTNKFTKLFKTLLPAGPIIPIDKTFFWKIGNKILLEINANGDTLSKEILDTRPTNFRYRGDELLMATNHFLDLRKTRLRYKKRGQPLQLFLAGPEALPQDLSIMTNAAFDRHGGSCFYDQHVLRWYLKGQKKPLVIPFENNQMTLDRYLTLYFDEDNNLWVGGRSGLKIIEAKPTAFQTYLDSSFYNPRGIIGLDNLIVANTYKGLMSITSNGNGRKNQQKIADFAARGMWRDANRLWSAGPRNEIRSIKMDPLAVEKMLIPIPEGKELILQSNCVIKDQKKILWVGTNIGLARLPENGTNFEWSSIKKIAGLPINCLYENKEGIWIGAKTGLFLMNSYSAKAFQAIEIGYANVLYIFESPEGDFWIATKEGGLIFWDRKHKTVRRFTNLDGLSSNTVYGIFQDEAGCLWLPSGYGLMRMDLPSHLVTTFFKRDGLPGDEFNPYAHFQGTDGRLIFGGENGLTVFYPNQIRQQLSKTQQKVVFTKLEKLYKSTGQIKDFTKQFQEEGNLSLTPETGFIILHVAAKEYVNPGKISYAYRIEGLQKDWIFVREHSFRLGGLPYGQYNLLVKAQGAFGQWTKPLSIKLNVIAPFYYKWWFWVVIAGLVFLLLFGIFQLRIKIEKDQQIWLQKEITKATRKIEADKTVITEQMSELERINRLKDRIFMIIGHELRGPAISLSTLSDTVSYLIQKGKIDRAIMLGKDADRTAKGLKILIDNLLSWGRAQTEQLLLLPELFFPAEIAKEALEFFSLSVQEKDLSIHSDFDSDFELFMDKNAFRIIILNLLSNAIKFTKPQGEIHIQGSWSKNGQRAIIKITDNGVGIPKERLKTLFEGDQPSMPGTKGERGVGIGLAVCKELVNSNQGDICVDSKPGKGTTFKVDFPVSTKNHKVNEKHSRIGSGG